MRSYKTHFTDKKFLLSFLSGAVLLGISLVVQFLVSNYVTRSSSGSVTDIILSNTRVYDVGGIFVWGSVILTTIGFLVLLRRPNYMPFVMKSVAIFTLIRSVFVSLTHISPFPTRALIDSTFFTKEVFAGIFTGNDLFFSGHTGVPFLLALIFWENKKLRFLFLGFSILFAIVVLLGHLHYSIDVLSAYFITFSIFHICKYFFKKTGNYFLKKMMRHCKDCEPAQESHFIAYTSVVLSWIDQPFFDLMERLFKNIAERMADKITLPFFNLMVFLKLGYFSFQPDEKDTWRTKCFWDEAKRRGIKMREFHLGPIKDGFVAEYGNKTIIFDGLPRPGFKESPALKWMDNKGIMKIKFLKEGLPVADGGVAFTKRTALKIFNRLQKPVITKPNLGSRSRHTMIHINTRQDLVLGFKKAKKLSPLVVIEEELRGYLFRGTLIGGKLAGVVKRDQPEVEGDGAHTLRELMEEENKRPERNGPIFHKIIIDKETEIELKRENITMDDIPENGKVVTFSQKTSRGCGGTTTEVTDITHPENIKMLEHVAKFLADPLIGVDFIIEDITKSWKEEQHCGIIECNSLPFIDLHHYPLFGRPNNVAGKLWDLVMPESKIN